jgi:hypothetical protein
MMINKAIASGMWQGELKNDSRNKPEVQSPSPAG